MKYIIIIVSMFLIAGCYKDKGSYSYTEVNEISIDLPKTVGVRLPKKDSVLFEIEANVKQLKAKNDEKLSYKWEKKVRSVNLSNKFEEICTESKCHMWFKPEDKSTLILRLTVTDNSENGTVWYKETVLSPITPYSRCWFVLQNDNNNSLLGVIDGDGNNAVVVKDAYGNDMGSKLPINGIPKRMIGNVKYGDGFGFFVPQHPVIGVMTDKDIMVMDASFFKTKYTMSDLLYGEKLKGNTNFSPEAMISKTNSSGGELIINSGQVYYSNIDGYSVFYPTSIKDDRKTIDAKMASYMKGSFIVYDDLNKRFLRTVGSFDYSLLFTNQRIRFGSSGSYSQSKRIKTFEQLGENPNAKNNFNPNDIGSDKIALYMDVSSGTNKMLAFFYGQDDNKIYVYELNNRGFSDDTKPICSGVFKLNIPTGFTYNDVKFATSHVYDRIFFMSVGNKVYKVDLNRALPTLTKIYEHTNQDVRITGMKFRLNDTKFGGINSAGEWTSYYLDHILGVILDYGDDKGGIVDIRLNSAGDIDRDYNAIFEYKGFNKIVDIVYNIKSNI